MRLAVVAEGLAEALGEPGAGTSSSSAVLTAAPPHPANGDLDGGLPAARSVLVGAECALTRASSRLTCDMRGILAGAGAGWQRVRRRSVLLGGGQVKRPAVGLDAADGLAGLDHVARSTTSDGLDARPQLVESASIGATCQAGGGTPSDGQLLVRAAAAGIRAAAAGRQRHRVLVPGLFSQLAAKQLIKQQPITVRGSTLCDR